MSLDADIPAPTGARLALLRRLGFDQLQHDSHVPFLAHLLGTRRLLVSWGERPAMADAGLFHSAYGTEYFQPDQSAERDEVAALIGDDAERTAWLWCTIRRDTLSATEPWTAVDRHTQQAISLSEAEAADVATLWAADTVEQIARMDEDERAFSDGLGRVLHLARPAAQDAVDAIRHVG
ncbi:MAG TPA: hypothetical protein VGM93_07525 [Acidimicrobiales bacterium]